MHRRNTGSSGRVAITGTGVLSPAGDEATTFTAALAGRSTARPIAAWDASDHPIRFACELQDFDPTEWVAPREVRRIDRASLIGIVAAERAIARAGLGGDHDLDPARVGVIAGSGVGGILTYEQQHEQALTRGPDRVSPFFIPMMMVNATAALIAMRHGFRGPCLCVATACASGANSIGEGAWMVRSGRVDICLAGGTEAAITPTALAGFARMGALSTRNDDPQAASRPFDLDRDGFVMGEGAGFLVLERWDHATERGAEIIGEVLGYAASCDASHITAPDPSGAAAIACMRGALADAGVDPGHVGHVNAHGTSTPLNDSTEAAALRAVFGADGPPVTSTKGTTGHLIGGAGAVEAVLGLRSAIDGIVPPIANLTTPGVDGIDLVYADPRATVPGPVLSSSLGFGGHNAALVLAPAE